MIDSQIDIPLGNIDSQYPHLDLSEMEWTIAEIIYRRDADNPVPVTVIERLTQLSGRAIRNIIRDLIMEYGLPIGSQSAANKPGFYWITSLDELEQAAQRQINRGINTIVRGYRLKKQNLSDLVGQLKVALDG